MDGRRDEGSRAHEADYDQGVHRISGRDHGQRKPGGVVRRTLHQQLALLSERDQHEHLEHKFPLEETQRGGAETFTLV